LLCASLVEIKAAKFQICIIDRTGDKIPLMPFNDHGWRVGDWGEERRGVKEG
jgi:hypothetical protein